MINQETIRSARKAPLAEVLLQRAHSLIEEGMGFYRDPKMGGLIIKDNYWYQHSTGLKGNTVEYFMIIEKMTFNNSIRLVTKTDLSEIKTESNTNTEVAKKENWNLKQEEIRYTTTRSRSKQYLQKRGIDSTLLRNLYGMHLIKEDRSGNVCFMGHDEQEIIRCISYRSLKTARKGDVAGSDKRYTFHMKDYLCERPEDRVIILAESPIDILSIATLENIKYRNGFYHTYKIATCGTASAQLINRIKNLQAKKIFIVMDPDQQGQKMAEILKESLQDFTLVKNITLPNSLDPNEYLLEKLSRSS